MEDDDAPGIFKPLEENSTSFELFSNIGGFDFLPNMSKLSDASGDSLLSSTQSDGLELEESTMSTYGCSLESIVLVSR